MTDSKRRVYMARPEFDGKRSRGDAWVQWAREAVTIIAAAGAAYAGIRVDLARNQLDIDNLKTQQARIESQVEKIRDAGYSLGAGQGGKK